MNTPTPPTTLEAARAAKPRALAAFSPLADVVGIGITRIGDTYALKVNLATEPEPSAKLPTTIEGVPVRVEVVGTIRKQ